MAFGESEIGERLDLLVDLVGEIAGDPVLTHAFIQLVAQLSDAFDAAFRSHRTAQQICVITRAATDRHRDLHELLLEQRYPECPFQDRFERRLLIGHGFLDGGTAYVWVHRAALDRARPNQRDLDHEVVETAVSYTHLRAHETDSYLVCRLLL